MKDRRQLPDSSFVTGRMPISCVMCQQGSKMVLLITGLCPHDCYYCPLSLEKQGKRVTYANEKRVESDQDILFEARSIDARGTGITGGDPLVEMEKTLHYIRLLKDEFGKGHDIHLYTSTTEPDKIRQLARAGLNEIRFHPPRDMWDGLQQTRFVECIELAVELGLKTGIEIPAIPGTEVSILKLARTAYRCGARFLNLNELEFSESNWQELKERGFKVKDDVSSAVLGSQETAQAVAEDLKMGITLHYCSSSFKDATQLRNRILRRAGNVSTLLDTITGEGTFIRGVVECQHPEEEMKRIAANFEIPEDLIRFDAEKDRIEIAAWILEEIHDEINGLAFIIEEYPTADRLEVERRPL